MEAQGEEGRERRCKFMGALFEHSGRDVVRTGRLANVELVQEAFHCLQAEVDSGKWGGPGLASMREIPPGPSNHLQGHVYWRNRDQGSSLWQHSYGVGDQHHLPGMV